MESESWPCPEWMAENVKRAIVYMRVAYEKSLTLPLCFMGKQGADSTDIVGLRRAEMMVMLRTEPHVVEKTMWALWCRAGEISMEIKPDWAISAALIFDREPSEGHLVPVELQMHTELRVGMPSRYWVKGEFTYHPEKDGLDMGDLRWRAFDMAQGKGWRSILHGPWTQRN